MQLVIHPSRNLAGLYNNIMRGKNSNVGFLIHTLHDVFIFKIELTRE